jgi:hypothetical protein
VVASKQFWVALAVLLFLLAAPLITTAQEGARPAAGGPGIHNVLQDPVAYDGATLQAGGTVVRTSRRLESGEARTSLLLRDDAGDTLSVLDPPELPPVGSRIQVSGRIELIGGVPVLRGTQPDLRLQVLERAPDGAAAARRRDENGLRLSSNRCVNPPPRSLSALVCGVLSGPSWGWLGLLGAAGLAAGGWLWWRRRSQWEDAPVPLIVDLSAPPQVGITPWEQPAEAGTAQPPRVGAGAAAEPSEPLPVGASPPAAGPTAGGEPVSEPELSRTEPAATAGSAEPTPPRLSTVRGPAAGPERRNGHGKAREPAKVTPEIVAGRAGAANRPPIPGVPISRILPAPPEAPVLEPESPDEGVLQLLPGRLEVIAGDGLSPEIRLFRVSSLDVPEITFGRADGPAYRHVKLNAATVSREHARIRYEDRKWKMINLSRINPVVVNGVEMASPDDEWTLGDGDRIEIGEVVLRYREA